MSKVFPRNNKKNLLIEAFLFSMNRFQHHQHQLLRNHHQHLALLRTRHLAKVFNKMLMWLKERFMIYKENIIAGLKRRETKQNMRGT